MIVSRIGKILLDYLSSGESDQGMDLTSSVMTEEQAKAKAHSVVEAEGWSWLEPVQVRLMKDEQSRRKIWSVATNGYNLGNNTHIVIDDETGAVLRKVFFPR